MVTDSVFSMDGDYAPLPELVALKQQYGLMLMVDEAHSGGILGAEGEGLTGHLGLSAQVDVLMGTFSKAYGVYGAYVAGDRQVCDYLVNACRTLIYTTALPPVLLALLQRSIEVVRADAWRRQRLQDNALVLHQALRDHGLSVPETASHILPLRIGDDVAAVSLSRRLEDAGLAAVAIRPPTVPAGTARLRLTVSAAHERADLVAAAETIAAQLRD